MPDVRSWSSPDDEAVDLAIVGLLAGDDLTRWSDDVVRALLAHNAFLRAWRCTVDAHPEVREQLRTGVETAIICAATYLERHAHPNRDELLALAETTWNDGVVAMREIAEPQQRPAVVDGWRWRGRNGGRPTHVDAPALLLRVEVWADLRGCRLPGEIRLTRSEALAEVLLADLQREDSARANRVRWLRQDFVEKGHPPARALVRAIRSCDNELRASFESLQSLFSQVLRRYGPSPTRAADARYRQIAARRRSAAAPLCCPSATQPGLTDLKKR